MVAGVPLGNVLVNDVTTVNISGSDCLTASLWITGVDGVLHVVTDACHNPVISSRAVILSQLYIIAIRPYGGSE